MSILRVNLLLIIKKEWDLWVFKLLEVQCSTQKKTSSSLFGNCLGTCVWKSHCPMEYFQSWVRSGGWWRKRSGKVTAGAGPAAGALREIPVGCSHLRAETPPALRDLWLPLYSVVKKVPQQFVSRLVSLKCLLASFLLPLSALTFRGA